MPVACKATSSWSAVFFNSIRSSNSPAERKGVKVRHRKAIVARCLLVKILIEYMILER